ncbi:pentapeptide repeat-containing protein [Mameliella alba]|uniref:Pentapeptide repeat-containing protein n=1 Tax=Mameliella alba TaxID=561184 RepID=A0A0B3SGL4_9RHOB|nr:pentapeptide repeat-containing protein [Mameliella alba]KHQ49739.1 hypothetical protein OA50_05702 [Mameliella alba]
MTPAELRERLVAPWRHGEHADLRGVTCEGRLDLSGCEVAGFDLSGASFPEGIDARGARFLGLSWLRDVRFGGRADFGGAVFLNDARFEGARFDGAARFSGIEFRGIGRFDGARFEAEADFSGAVGYGNCSLAQVSMQGPTSFRDSEWLGGLWCQDAALPADADLAETQVHGRLWLRGARQGNGALKPAAFGMSFGYTYL